MDRSDVKRIAVVAGTMGAISAGILMGSCIDRRTQPAPAVEEVVEEEYDNRVVTLEPTAYARIQEGAPDEVASNVAPEGNTLYSKGEPGNRFEGTALYVGSASNGKNRVLVQYDLKGLDGVLVSGVHFEASDVVKAELVFGIDGTCWSSYDNTQCDRPLPMRAFRSSASWDPAQITWNNYGDGYSSFGAYGADFAAWKAAGEPTEVSVPQGQYELVRLDATAGVKALLSGAANNGFVVKAIDSGEVTGRGQTDAAMTRPPVLAIYLNQRQ